MLTTSYECTLPETNGSPLKIDGWKTTFLEGLYSGAISGQIIATSHDYNLASIYVSFRSVYKLMAVIIFSQKVCWWLANATTGSANSGKNITRWWMVVVSIIFYFHPYLGKNSNLTNILQMG